MNALTLISNQNAQALAENQAAINTTAPVVDGYRPEAAAEGLSSNLDKKMLVGDTLYHTLFVGVFLFGSIAALGSLTGELDLGEVVKT